MLITVPDLLRVWRDALPPSAPPAAASRIGDDLMGRWNQPHRHYHTAEHLARVLSVIDDYAGTASDAAAVRLAAWYHDAIYDPFRVDNEEASALLAEATLPDLGVAPERIHEVARLIRLTASHDPAPGDRNGSLLTDADLAILAAPRDEYRTYTVAVRREYAHVPDAAFIAGRAEVLNNLLRLPRLFHTPALRERWEDLARQNISRELTDLRNDLLPPGPRPEGVLTSA
jgi:predicted metal-dependent HD superfamily phosphohydrolase